MIVGRCRSSFFDNDDDHEYSHDKVGSVLGQTTGRTSLPFPSTPTPVTSPLPITMPINVRTRPQHQPTIDRLSTLSWYLRIRGRISATLKSLE